jgi:hypothetical protein
MLIFLGQIMKWVQLRATYMGEKTVVVSLTCSKRTDTMVKLCEVFESLKLKIITANITAFSGRLVKTVFVEVTPFSLPLICYSLFHIYIIFHFSQLTNHKLYTSTVGVSCDLFDHGILWFKYDTQIERDRGRGKEKINSWNCGDL